MGFEYTNSGGHNSSHNREAAERIVFGWPSRLLSGTMERMEEYIIKKVNMEEGGGEKEQEKMKANAKTKNVFPRLAELLQILPGFIATYRPDL